DGDLVLLGANLPHMWRNDEIYFKPASGLRVEAVAIHFLPECLGKVLLNAPEMKPVRLLLRDAARGFRITGGLHASIRERMEGILEARGVRRRTTVLEMLYDIAVSEEKRGLSSLGFVREDASER